jgi:CheY-like chemotaxis protein
MDKLNRILVVDDDESFKEDLVRSFEEEIVDVVFCLTKDEAIKNIDSRQHFDLLILDWFLEEPDSSMLSQLVLDHLYNKRFVPVFIWSKHIEDFNSEMSNGTIKYPNILIDGISKDDVTVDKLELRIRQLMETSLTAQISRVYRESIADNLEKIFFDLAEIQNEDLASLLKILIGGEENIDWSNDFILNLIHRRLLDDVQFVDKLKNLLSAAGGRSIDEEEQIIKRRKIINKFLYFHAAPCFFRCGDIVGIKVGNEMLKYGIVVTPDCDIAQRNTKFLELIEIRNIEDCKLGLTPDQKRDVMNYKHISLYYFPCLIIEEHDADFVAIFKSKFIAEGLFERNEEKYPKVPQKLSYSAKFLVNGQEAILIHVCSMSNPYKSDFLQKLYANNSRVGTPDIKNLLLV